tara:strand:+ start:265 stop:708 length:444 start_codon:yes stop_codon:yes gene_type:complete
MPTVTINPIATEELTAITVSTTSVHTPLLTNGSGAAIPQYSAVYMKTDGTLALAIADDEDTAKVIGFASETLVDGGTGRITVAGTSGYISETDSAAVVDGDLLYLSATEAGSITKTSPTGTDVAVNSLGRAVGSEILVEIGVQIVLA